MSIMELSSITILAIKGTLVHKALARAPKYIKKHQITKTKKKRQHKAMKNHPKKKKPNMEERMRGGK